LREPRINAHASPVATVPEVRKRITDDLRAMTKFVDLIIEGRDITTAVFPDTPARFYLEADPAVRAARRQLEEVQKGVANQSVEDVKASLLARDKIDSSRACAPLRKADGVIAIDSTYLTLEQVIQSVMDQLPEDWKKPVEKDASNG
jgi:cytidylate kinase